MDAGTPALLVAAAEGPMLPEMTGLARRIAATGADVYGIGGDHDFAATCRSTLPGPSLPEHLAPFGLVVPGQLLGKALALARAWTRTPPRPGQGHWDRRLTTARSEPSVGAAVGAAVSFRRPDAAWTA